MSVPSRCIHGTAARTPPPRQPVSCVPAPPCGNKPRAPPCRCPASAVPPAPVSGRANPRHRAKRCNTKRATPATPRRQIRPRRRRPRRTVCGCNTIRFPTSRSGLSGSAGYRPVCGHPAPIGKQISANLRDAPEVSRKKRPSIRQPTASTGIFSYKLELASKYSYLIPNIKKTREVSWRNLPHFESFQFFT